MYLCENVSHLITSRTPISILNVQSQFRIHCRDFWAANLRTGEIPYGLGHL